MSTQNESPDRPLVTRKFIDHKVASIERDDVTAVLYEYLIAGNGLFMRAVRSEFTAALPVCKSPIRGLPESNVGIVWHRPRIDRYLWQEIWQHVYDFNGSPESNVVDVFIARVRAKIEREGSPQLIHTKRGQGYLLGPVSGPAEDE